MNPKKDLAQSGQSRPALSPAPRKRFRLEKLEERIAPHCRGLHLRRYADECYTAWKCAG